jgi:excisionase family DNA binding protein
MELTTRETAQRLNVHPSRVRALIASGALRARRVGNQWLIDIESLDRHAELIAGHARGRPMSQRVAWATAALVDGIPDQLEPSERYRLRRRLTDVSRSVETIQRWMSRRADGTSRYRVGERDISALLGRPDVVATGISAAADYGIGLGAGASADAYVTSDTRDRLIREHFLIASGQGNLTLRVVDEGWHLVTMRPGEYRQITPRLIVAVDLAEDTDLRTRNAGRELISDALQSWGRVNDAERYAPR